MSDGVAAQGSWWWWWWWRWHFAAFGFDTHSVADASESTEFSSQSGNIACAMSTSGANAVHFVRCDIAEFTYNPPAAPADCGPPATVHLRPRHYGL